MCLIMWVLCFWNVLWHDRVNNNAMQNLIDDKIYVVDDDQFTAELYEQRISQLGFSKISKIQSGTECLNRLIDEPRIVFLDYQMGEVNGFEVLKKIKRFNPAIYVVIVSGQEDMKVAIDSLKYGAFDYIIKGETALDRLEEVLARISRYEKSLEESNPTLLDKVRSIFKK